MQQKLVQNYFTTGAFGNNIGKEPQKLLPKLLCFALLCLQSNASGSFLQTCINFVEQPLTFSNFEGSIIP